MNLQTRYALGDIVWGLSVRPHRYWRACPVCDGTCRVKVEGHPEMKAYCPSSECERGKLWLEMGSTYEIRELTIGQVRVTVGYDARIEYMCRETGLGSGQVWSEDRLHPSEEDAVTSARDSGARTQAEMQLLAANG